VGWLADNDPGVDVTVIATATDPLRPNYPPGEWLTSAGVETPILLDDEEGTAATAYGLPAYPFWVVVDSQGRVLGRISGELSEEDMGVIFGAAASS